MKLPEKVTMREAMHGHGARGYAFYLNEDTLGLGVTQTVTLNPHRTVYGFDWLPEREFKTYGELCVALRDVTDEQIAAEKAKWPQVVTEREASDSPCRLCRSPGKLQVTLQESPRPTDARIGTLCDACTPLAKDPPALLAAFEAEVAARRARAAAKGRPW